jgi:RNA recognition motif-containing protein
MGAAAEEEEEGGRNTWQGREREPDDTSFYVGDLPYSVDSAELFNLFKNAGNVTKVEVKYNKETGRSWGFAFVNMETKEDVAKIVERFNGIKQKYLNLAQSSNTGFFQPESKRRKLEGHAFYIFSVSRVRFF